MNSSSDVCRGCMNEVLNNGVSLAISNIAELYQNCTGIEVLINLYFDSFYTIYHLFIDKQSGFNN